MDFRQLEYFISVAKTENMGVSAEGLHISQPALSMSIKRFEEELGVELFDRVNHSIRLNPNGRIFLRYAQACLDTINEGKTELARSIEKKNCKVSIMCPVYYLTGIIFEAFISIHPESSVEYRSIQYWQIEEALINRDVDVCISTQAAKSDLLENIFLAERNLGVLCYKDHPFARKKELLISDLQNERHLSYPDTKQPRLDLEFMCNKRGFRPNVVFESESMTTLLGMCRKKMGIICTSQEATKLLDMSDLCFVPFTRAEEEGHVNLYLITHKENHDRPLVNDFKNIILDTIKQESL